MSDLAPPLRAIDRAAIRVVLPILDRYATEPLRIRNGGDADLEIGVGHGRGEDPGPDFDVRHPAVWKSIGRRGISALGPSYADGWWTTGDLAGVLRFFVALTESLPSTPNVDPITRRVRSEIRPASSLGADDPTVLGHIYDKTMFGGTGRYESGATDLYAAALARFSSVCDALDICAEDRILELGTGWGAFSMFAARTRQCEVVTVTESPTAAKFAAKRLANAGLARSVDIKVGGQTSVNERFTKIVSLNADLWRSGPLNLPAAIDSLLAPGGQALVVTHLSEQSATSGAFTNAPHRPTLSAAAKALTGRRIGALSEVATDDLRSIDDRIANLTANRETLDRAGYTESVYRARHFALVRDQVMAERQAIRAVELRIY